MSAMDLFIQMRINEVVIPVLPGHREFFERIIDKFVAQMAYYPRIAPVVIADDQSGVCNAITRAGDSVNDDLFVLCGDNIYKDFYIPDDLMKGGAAIREVPPEQLQHLVRWSKNGFSSGYGDRALITPWVLPRLWCRLAHLYSSVPEFLNVQKAPAVMVQDGEWWDIGTEQTYEAYWLSED